MKLKDKLLERGLPVTFFEIVPPEEGNPAALDAVLHEAGGVRHLVDAINLPEIHDEARGGERTYRFIPRVEPRLLGDRMQREAGVEAVINRVVVHDAEPAGWFALARDQFKIENAVLVGGESAQKQYPGPGPVEAAKLIRTAGLDLALGGSPSPAGRARRTESEPKPRPG